MSHIYIKNTSQIDKIWVGMTVIPSQYYNIEEYEVSKWANDSQVLSDIGSGIAIVAKSNDGTQDIVNVSSAINYLKGFNYEVDVDGRQITRSAATNKGWSYQAFFFEIETSSGTYYNHSQNGQDLNEIVVTRYDVNNQITNVTLDTVKTVVTLKRPFDFEIVSGSISQKSRPTSPIRLWVTAGLYNEASNYSEISVIKFVEGGMNLEYFDSAETDGRASKYVKHTTAGAPFPTNRFQYTIKHTAGELHKIQIRMDLYKQ